MHGGGEGISFRIDLLLLWILDWGGDWGFSFFLLFLSIVVFLNVELGLAWL
jgi:hypothetical protein